MKKIDRCTNSDCSSTSTLQSAQPIADYVEDLQFSGMKNGKVASTGAVEYGMGNKKWFYPDSVTLKTPHQSKCVNLMDGFDGNPDTVAECKSDSIVLYVNFNKFVRIEKVIVSTAAHLDGGSYTNHRELSYNHDAGYNALPFTANGIAYPYGKNYVTGIQSSLWWYPSQWQCVHNTPCNSEKWLEYPFNFHGKNTKCDIVKYSQNCIRRGSNPSSNFYKAAGKKLLIDLSDGFSCTYATPSSNCVLNHQDTFTNFGDIAFYGEVYGEVTIPTEVEIGLLLRSPNEHQTKSKSFSMNMGNRDYASNDKYMRDSFSTSVIVRNLYYASH
jgi:hypothetical protein